MDLKYHLVEKYGVYESLCVEHVQGKVQDE